MTMFLIRAPVFPVILGFHGTVFGLRHPEAFERLVKSLRTPDGGPKWSDLIDATWGGFHYYREGDVITPLCIKTRWNKRELVELVNGRTNRSGDQPDYTTRSLGNRSKDRVFSELLDLVDIE